MIMELYNASLVVTVAKNAQMLFTALYATL